MHPQRAIYIRTSPTKESDGRAQLHELENAAKARGWGDHRVFKDLDESGTRDNRPQWNKLRAEIRAGRVNEVMATEIARLGRSAVSVILALDEISRAGCNVILTRQGLDYATPVGRMVAQILAAVAEMEREQSAERRRAGIARAREKRTRSGKPIGRPRRQIDARRAARLRSEGRSWREVARLVGGSTRTVRRAVAVWHNLARESSKSTAAKSTR